jgi:hypothetical protein
MYSVDGTLKKEKNPGRDKGERVERGGREGKKDREKGVETKKEK